MSTCCVLIQALVFDKCLFLSFPEMAKTAGSVDFPTLESRILGTIYGNCLGDAIGLLTEFMVKKEASKV